MNRERIPVTQPTLPTIESVLPHLQAILDSRMLSNFGRYAQSFEAKAAEYLGNRRVSAVANADLGLIIALKALHLPPQGEVLLPSFTFASTANAVIWSNLTPVFVDIDPRTFNVDPQALARTIGPKTCAVVGVHVFGCPCDIDGLERAAGGLPIVYDAAHAFGGAYKGRRIGTFRDIEVFSFSGTKLVTSAEGGIVATTRSDVHERLKYLRAYGFHDDYNCKWVGLNAKMSELNAMLGVLTMGKIGDFVARRNELAEFYRARLKPYGVEFQEVSADVVHTYKDFAILHDRRDELAEFLARDGIETKKYFFPVHTMDAYRDYRDADLPATMRIARRVLCLPMFSHMSRKQIEHVSSVVQRFFEERSRPMPKVTASVR